MERSGFKIRLCSAFLALLGALAVSADCRAPAAAAASIKLGAYVPNAPEDAAALDGYAAMVGRKPDIVMKYSNVTDPLLTSTEVSNLEARAETPMVTWQLYKSGWSGPTISLGDIAAGAYDDYLRRAANLAQSLPFEVMIRFGHEMNGDWYPWSGHPSAYVDAWRHIVAVFRREGATNVKWVWSPNVDLGSYPFARYFPGDSWVDYVALDGYNWGTAGVGTDRWQTLSQVFSSSYKAITQMSTKPVVIAETSSSEVGGDKAAWIREGFLRTIPQQFPRVRAVVWFDRWMEEDWRVNSSQESLQAFQDVVSSSLYGGPDPAPATTAVRALQVTPSKAIPAADQGSTLRGKVVYRLSRRARVHIALHRRRAKPVRAVTIDYPRRRGRVRLSTLFRRRRIHRGTYRVVARAVDAGGARSRARRVRFRIV
ncbi:MAG TPA: glycosyl hydrolase [Solirubrobacterales bacterium]|nr:glycosyl hydrolase [Solirubrobacterales bacterium]